MLLAVVAAVLAMAPASHATEVDGIPSAVLSLHSDGAVLGWSSPRSHLEPAGRSVLVQLDTVAVAGVRSDVVRLSLSVDGGSATLSAPSPFGGDEHVGAMAPDAPGEAVVQVGRRVPVTITFAEPGAHVVRILASVPGSSARLEAATELVVAAGAPSFDPDAAPLVASGRSHVSGQAGTLRTAGAAQRSGEPLVISSGHVDMGPRVVDGGWRIQLKDDTVTPAVWRELSEVVLQAVDESKSSVPAGEQFEFLGEAGSDIWLLPQAQQPAIVWPGWNTQDPSVASVATGPVTWRLHGVDGPGSFALFLTGSFGAPEVIFDSDRPLPQPHPVALGTHVHGNWAFTEPGVYRLDVEMSAPTASGAVTDRRSLTFAVGVVDPALVGGGSTTSTVAAADGGGATQQVTTSRGAASRGRTATGSSEMADTGRDVGWKVGLGMGLVAVGGALLAYRPQRS